MGQECILDDTDSAHFTHRTTTQNAANLAQNIVTLDLFQSDDWEALLLGERQLHKQRLHFKPSPLFEALNKNPIEITGICLKNAPWHLSAFKEFWEDALNNRSIPCYGVKLALPETLAITHREEYDWPALLSCVNQSSGTL